MSRSPQSLADTRHVVREEFYCFARHRNREHSEVKIIVSLLLGFIAGMVVAGQAPMVHAFLGTKGPETYSPSERATVGNIRFDSEKSFCADLWNVSTGTVELVTFELKVTLPKRSSPLTTKTGGYQSDYIMVPGHGVTLCWGNDEDKMAYSVQIDGQWRSLKSALDAGDVEVRATAVKASYQN